MGDTLTMNWLDDLARAIELDGIACHEMAVERVVRQARTAGVCSILLDVLAGRTEPASARERAFGRVAGVLSSITARPAALAA